jgi:hypothetical protein
LVLSETLNQFSKTIQFQILHLHFHHFHENTSNAIEFQIPTSGRCVPSSCGATGRNAPCPESRPARASCRTAPSSRPCSHLMPCSRSTPHSGLARAQRPVPPTHALVALCARLGHRARNALLLDRSARPPCSLRVEPSCPQPWPLRAEPLATRRDQHCCGHVMGHPDEDLTHRALRCCGRALGHPARISHVVALGFKHETALSVRFGEGIRKRGAV